MSLFDSAISMAGKMEFTGPGSLSGSGGREWHHSGLVGDGFVSLFPVGWLTPIGRCLVHGIGENLKQNALASAWLKEERPDKQGGKLVVLVWCEYENVEVEWSSLFRANHHGVSRLRTHYRGDPA